MTKTINICAFLRFGEEKYIMDLYENGTIYCNTIQEIRKIENNFRGDKNEGIRNLRNFRAEDIKYFTIQPTDKSFPPVELKVNWLQLKEFEKNITANLYCLYVVKTDDVLKSGSYKIQSENQKFGSHFLLIHDHKRFLDLIVGELNINAYKFNHGIVDYHDYKQHNGELTFFSKSNDYSYQNEFRFLIQNTENNPIVLRIGSLKGIAQVYEMSKLTGVEIKSIKRSS